jgi:spore germination cell wall hydrolase CwlJ-like protein
MNTPMRWAYRLIILGLAGCLIYVVYDTNNCLRRYRETLHQKQQLEQRVMDQNGHITDLQTKEKFYEGIVLAQQSEIRLKAQAKQKRADFTASELRCLAENVYREAAFEPENGQLAVATVVMNRVSNPLYPKTVCDVVYERHLNKKDNKIVCQFSWSCKPRRPMATSVYKAIMAMARQVYFKHVRSEEAADATLYYADYIPTPDWAMADARLAQIGHHIFFSH